MIEKWIGARRLGVALALTTSVCCHAESDAPAGQAAPAAKPATIKSAMADVGDISAEMKKLEKRLESLDQSVAAINGSLKHLQSLDQSLVAVNNSLAPVGALARPEGLTALMREAEEFAYQRGLALIFVATGCAAALIVLFALLRRWTNRSLDVASARRS